MHKETFYTKKNIQKTKIALISDIHFYENYNIKIFNRITNQIKKEKPNYITIVGDILDSSSTTNLTKLESFLVKLSSLATTLVVLGNHDEKAGHMHNWSYNKNEALLKLLNSIDNLHFLDDTSFNKDNINFYGFNFSYKYYEEDCETYESFCDEIKKLNYELPEESYNITLFHSPINIYKFIKNNKNHSLNKSNLILSGHMHNGCLPYFFSHFINKVFKTSRGILSPTRKFFPKYAHGKIYERDGYVYEGITKLSNSTKFLHKFDVFFQKNVEFITIKKIDK